MRTSILLVLITLTASGCQEIPNSKWPQGMAPPVPLKVILGRVEVVPCDWPVWENSTLLCGQNGRRWLFTVAQVERQGKSQNLVFSYSDGHAWRPFEIIAPCGMFFPGAVPAAIDNTGAPVVAWEDQDQSSYVRHLYLGRWSGRGFSVTESASGVSAMASTLCSDRHGTVHRVYSAKLKPPESYSIGLLIVDGEFPPKFWHTTLKDGVWSQAGPTSGPGRYYPRDPDLCADPNGNVWLTYVVNPFSQLSREPAYGGAQMWNGKEWSALMPITPSTHPLRSVVAAADMGGALHVLWTKDDEAGVPSLNYHRVEQGHFSPLETIGKDAWGSVVTDSEGHVFMVWSNNRSAVISVKVWNGREWSQAITVPIGDGGFIKLASLGQGKVCLSWSGKDGVHLQEISAEPAGNKPQVGPSNEPGH